MGPPGRIVTPARQQSSATPGYCGPDARPRPARAAATVVASAATMRLPGAVRFRWSEPGPSPAVAGLASGGSGVRRPLGCALTRQGRAVALDSHLLPPAQHGAAAAVRLTGPGPAAGESPARAARTPAPAAAPQAGEGRHRGSPECERPRDGRTRRPPP